jgi:hypothetical protein
MVQHGDACLDKVSGLWSSWIDFYRDDEPHIIPLIESDPFYQTSEKALEKAKEAIEEIRRIKL